MATIDTTQLLKQLTQPSKQMENLARGNVGRVLAVNKRLALGDLNQHPVSQELSAGPEGENITKTLSGRSGNLYAFLGFPKGFDPVIQIYDILDGQIKLKSLPPTVKTSGSKITYTYTVEAPTIREIYNQTKHPAANEFGDVSWVKAIEEGYDNLKYYLFKAGLERWSRSGAAIQSKTVVKQSPESSKPISYVSEILSKFVNRLRGL